MGLLRDIQNGATEDAVSLAVLLRKVKLLASRLGVGEIVAWADCELSGYDGTEELPPYRGPFPTRVVGDVEGPFGSGYKNLPFPTLALAQQYRDGNLFELNFPQGVAELQSLAAVKNTMREPWSADTVAAIPMLSQGGVVKWDRSMNWIAVWKVIPHATVVGVLDAIRNRLLDFSMQVGEEEPAVEHEQRLADPQRAERVIQIFHTTVSAGAANVALGSQDVNQTQELPPPFDTDGLVKYLRQLGLEDGAVDRLQDALREDADERHDGRSPNGPGRRVLTWLKEVSATGTSKIGVPVATALITQATQAVLHHFGL